MAGSMRLLCKNIGMKVPWSPANYGYRDQGIEMARGKKNFLPYPGKK